jgi:signal transduction histidine kinase
MNSSREQQARFDSNEARISAQGKDLADARPHLDEDELPRLSRVAEEAAEPAVDMSSLDWTSAPLWRDIRQAKPESKDELELGGHEADGKQAVEHAEAEQRLLVRLGLDLHDGPLQDLAFLTSDLYLFREQIRGVLGEDEDRERVLGRVDDLNARLLDLSDNLRRLAFSLTSTTLLEQPFRTALQAEVEALEHATEIRSTLTMQGSLSSLDSAQRIALVRIVREALANVREHSGASTVEIAIVAEDGVVRAEILDDGEGFDVAEKLAQAASSGRLGLAGMAERARLAGGQLRINSAPGGPTQIEVVLGRSGPERPG